MIDDGGRPGPVDRGDEQRDAATGPKPPSGRRLGLSLVQPPTETRHRRPALIAIGGLAVVAVILAGIALLSRVSASPASADTPVSVEQGSVENNAAAAAVTLPREVTEAELGKLPQATTFGNAPAAPRDPAPGQAPVGKVVHPGTAVPVFAAPGGDPVAAVPVRQPIGLAPHQTFSDTWLPILQEQPGWALVSLPLRPNGSVAWMYVDDPAVTVSSTPSVITVDRAKFDLTLSTNGAVAGHWSIGVGKATSVTPAGRTFLLAVYRDTKPTFSPIVVPLGAHSDTYESYGGGPGTVAVHTWPTADVFGKPSSDGCIRIPPDALQVLTEAMERGTLPLGTPVLIK